MLTARYHGPGDVRIEELPDAPEPARGQLRLRPTLVGLCGTDASEYATGPHFPPLFERHPHSGHVGPVVLGHEFVGVVDAVGEGVDGMARSDRVVAGAGVWCGECDPCRRGRTNLCERYYTVGLHADGGLAELVTVPSGMCVRVPDAVPDRVAVLAQPLAVAVHAADRGGVGSRRPLVVVGVGAIGVLLVIVGRARGAAPIVVADPVAARRRRALEFGADVAVDPTSEDLGAAVARASGESTAGPPVVAEASGTAAGLASAMEVATSGSTLLLVGLHDRAREVDLFRLSLREVDVMTTLAHVCETDLPEAVRILGRVDASPLVDRIVPLSRVVEDALRPMAEGAVDGKVLVSVHREV